MRGKRILLGITGGIAAYKIAFLIRLLKKGGAEVKVIMTPSAVDFISPLTAATLSGNPVGIEFWNKTDGTWNNHVDYGLWADLFLIAPLTANTLSKMAAGGCDNLLLATYLSMKSKTIVAPAMDLDMYAHPTTRRNLDAIIKDGVYIIPAESGELASGLSGEGRMAEPETMYDAILDKVADSDDYKGKHVLITAGPTYEAIDPVRFIGNHSSGKMGFNIAEAFLNAGARVTLVSGPVAIELTDPHLNVVKVQSAEDMHAAVQKEWPNADIGVFAAAVADYRPENIADQKIKKTDEENNLVLNLIKNPDILAWAGSVKQEHQVLIGFALETENLEENGRKKLERKNLDAIIMNSLNDEGAGFKKETNKISILDKRNNFESFELKSKKEVAQDILSYLKRNLA